MKHILFFLTVCLVQQVCLAQSEFSQDNATRIDKTLSVDIGPRPMGSPAERRAMEFALSKFREYGCDTVYIMPMDRTGRVNTRSGIAIGIKRGATGRIILIGGHIDSAGPEIPGADDDGSGSAVVMECARVLGHQHLQSTIVFCCWGGEEQGLEGSKYFADHYENLDSIALMLQVDMANGLGIIGLDPDTHNHSAPRWLVRAAVDEFSHLGYENLEYATHFYSLNYASDNAAGSDHESFLRKGIPSIDFTTDVTKPIHTPRDNFENFDPRGLKRSGDLLLRLVARYDGGVPSRETERYWLYLLGTTPLFFSFSLLWTFFAITIMLAVFTFITVRKRREPPDSPERIRWSGAKMFLFALMIVACGWLSSDFLGIIRGVRHSWLTAISTYYVLASIAMILGAWLCMKLLKKLPLSKCPYVFYKRAAIFLTSFMILLGILNIKLAVEPAVGLLFISLAMLSRNAWVKAILIALSPWWTLRLWFSEWSPLFFRAAASAMSSEISAIVLYNALFILILTVLVLPFFYALTAAIRDSASLNRFVPFARSIGVGAVALIAFITLSGFLLSQPVFDAFWQKDIHLDERYDMNDHSRLVVINSGEFLTGLHISHGGLDTSIEGRTTALVLTPRAPFDTTWLTIDRHEVTSATGDTTIHRVDLTLSSKFRPYAVNINYSAGHDQLRTFDTPWGFTTEGGSRQIHWYSFPDSLLHIPLEFRTVGNDSVKESIEVTFDSLAYPVKLQNDLSYVIPRTRYVQHYSYKK